jgi:hypothetical protein
VASAESSFLLAASQREQYGYPPDKQVIAAETVLQQAELFTEDWVKSTFESYPV